MIQLTDINGRTHAIHPDAIARLVEPGTYASTPGGANRSRSKHG